MVWVSHENQVKKHCLVRGTPHYVQVTASTGSDKRVAEQNQTSRLRHRAVRMQQNGPTSTLIQGIVPFGIPSITRISKSHYGIVPSKLVSHNSFRVPLSKAILVGMNIACFFNKCENRWE
jgi:hypothetical protein